MWVLRTRGTSLPLKRPQVDSEMRAVWGREGEGGSEGVGRGRCLVGEGREWGGRVHGQGGRPVQTENSGGMGLRRTHGGPGPSHVRRLPAHPGGDEPRPSHA